MIDMGNDCNVAKAHGQLRVDEAPNKGWPGSQVKREEIQEPGGAKGRTSA
jgi:hypothetical protein